MIERTEKEFEIVEKTNHRLVISNRELREQVSELEKLLIEQQDINKLLRETPAFSEVSGQVCAECKRKDEIIKWERFYSDLRDEVNCIDCNGTTECEDCKIYKDLLRQHKLDAAQN